MRTQRWMALVAGVGFGLWSAGAEAQLPPSTGGSPDGSEPDGSAEVQPGEEREEVETQPVDPQRARAREYYLRGVELVKQAQWSEALASFEKSLALFPNATTLFNMGACLRAMGRYTQARERLRQAVQGDDLPESTREEAESFLRGIEDQLLVRTTITLIPADAQIAIDGRPLVRQGDELVAGIDDPGEAQSVSAERFVVALDPGAHVITVGRKGFAPVAINETFAPGERRELRLELDRLPATLRVTATQPNAIVMVDGRDVGPTPIDVQRPAGTYRVVVGKDGYLDYEANVAVQPGEEVDLRAKLAIDEPTVFEEWWFWAGATAIVATGVLVTYAVTRPEPEPPPYDGGSSGWVVEF